MLLTAVLAALLLTQQSAARPAPSSVQRDVDRLVRAAQNPTGVWPTQAPPAIPEVALVARHGKLVAPAMPRICLET